MRGTRLKDDSSVTELFDRPGHYFIDGVALHGVLPNGEYIRVPYADSNDNKNWQLTEHDDGTVSLSPSILVHGNVEWHGYLRYGTWEEV